MAWIPKRWDGVNQIYFVTVVTKNRKPVFAEPRNCLFLQKAFKEVYKYYPFRLDALVILPDHWHALICPRNKTVIENVVGGVKANMLRQVWEIEKCKSIWQERFLDHRIRNEEDYNQHLQYIRMNPYKHGLIENPDDYQWYFINR